MFIFQKNKNQYDALTILYFHQNYKIQTLNTLPHYEKINCNNSNKHFCF